MSLRCESCLGISRGASHSPGVMTPMPPFVMRDYLLQLYGVSLADVDRDPRLLERRLDMAHSAAQLLDKHNLIKYDRRSGNFQVCAPACAHAAGVLPASPCGMRPAGTREPQSPCCQLIASLF